MKQYLSLILFLFLLAACDSSDAPEATGYGYINLNIGTNPEISVATTRAGDTDTDVSTYLITIKSGTTTYLSQKPYSIIQSTPLRFEAGTYSILRKSGHNRCHLTNRQRRHYMHHAERQGQCGIRSNLQRHLRQEP